MRLISFEGIAEEAAKADGEKSLAPTPAKPSAPIRGWVYTVGSVTLGGLLSLWIWDWLKRKES